MPEHMKYEELSRAISSAELTQGDVLRLALEIIERMDDSTHRRLRTEYNERYEDGG